MTYIYTTPLTSERYLAHHGILGQKWGVRRFQNADGSLTAAGKRRAQIGRERLEKRQKKVDKRYSIDRLAAKLGTRANVENFANTDQIVKKFRDANQAILDSDQRLVKLGRRTLTQRVATISVGSFVAGASAAALLPLGIPAAALGVAVSAIGTGITYSKTQK